jgi:CHAT domain-containing protein
MQPESIGNATHLLISPDGTLNLVPFEALIDENNRYGVYGLRRAFLLAGAESIVMSLWPVSDFVAREIMTHYYQSLKDGLGRSEALRARQLKMLQQKNREHPFYWPSFIQLGEWRSLKSKKF